jgi:hypothetical protein
MMENACSGTVGDVIDGGCRRGRESLIDVVTVVHWSKPSSRGPSTHAYPSVAGAHSPTLPIPTTPASYPAERGHAQRSR